jgi:ribosomal protein L11 methyltransferase
VAVRVAEENGRANGVPLGTLPGRLTLAVADGVGSPLIARSAPFDLIIANILAGPLIDMAPDIAAATAPGGQAVLSGLLTRQAEDVARAWRRAGFRLAEARAIGDWSTLRLVRLHHRRPPRRHRPSAGGGWAIDGMGF